MKISELGIERKFNLGHYEYITISVKIVPEKMDIKKEWEEAVEDLVGKLDQRAEKVKERISEGWFEDEDER